jgi:hypothetical protein
MDAGNFNPTKRLYPSYTTDQLLGFIAEGVTKHRTEDQIVAMKWEACRRKAGLSKTLHQILNG